MFQLELGVEMTKKAEAEAKAKAAAAATYTGYFSGWLGGKPAAVSRSEYLLTVMFLWCWCIVSCLAWLRARFAPSPFFLYKCLANIT